MCLSRWWNMSFFNLLTRRSEISRRHIGYRRRSRRSRQTTGTYRNDFKKYGRNFNVAVDHQVRDSFDGQPVRKRRKMSAVHGDLETRVVAQDDNFEILPGLNPQWSLVLFGSPHHRLYVVSCHESLGKTWRHVNSDVVSRIQVGSELIVDSETNRVWRYFALDFEHLPCEKAIVEGADVRNFLKKQSKRLL